MANQNTLSTENIDPSHLIPPHPSNPPESVKLAEDFVVESLGSKMQKSTPRIFEKHHLEQYFALDEKSLTRLARFNLIREKLMVIISIYGGLHNSELHALKFGDLQVQTIGTDILNISIFVPEYKTKKKDEEAFSFILSPNPEQPNMCPIRLYQRYLSYWDYVPNSDERFWKNMNPKQSKITPVQVLN